MRRQTLDGLGLLVTVLCVAGVPDVGVFGSRVSGPTLLAQASDGSTTKRAPLDPQTRRLAAEVERRFLRLTAFMGTLLDQNEDKEETGRLDVALRRARELKVTARLEKIRKLLDQGAVRDALEEEVLAEKDLRRILKILRGEDELETLRDEKERLAELEEQLERLERVREEQEEQNEETESALEKKAESQEGGDEPKPAEDSAEDESGLDRKLAERQRQLERRTQSVRREIERQERREEREKQDAQPKDGQPKDGQPQDGQPQDGQPQDGQPKDGQPKDGQPKDGQPKDGQAQSKQSKPRSSRQRAQESLRQAERKMNDAAQRLDAGNREGARQDQAEALEQLKRAESELAEEKDTKEEEAREELARKIAGRLYALLAEQELVTTDTRDVDARRPVSADPVGGEVPTTAPADVDVSPLGEEEFGQETRSLARRETALATDVEDVLRLVEEGEASVVAPEVLRRVEDDLQNISELLEAGRTGALVDTLQEDVETALRELIEILQPEKKTPRRQRPNNGPQSQPGEQKPPGEGDEAQKKKDLLKPAQEIRILVNAQRRLRERTRRAAEFGILPEGSAEDAAFREGQSQRIAEGQARLAELTDKLVEKYPIIDQYLLGVEDDEPESDAEPDGEADAPEAESSETESSEAESSEAESSETEADDAESASSADEQPGAAPRPRVIRGGARSE